MMVWTSGRKVRTYRVRAAPPTLTAGRTARENIVKRKKKGLREKVQGKKT